MSEGRPVYVAFRVTDVRSIIFEYSKIIKKYIYIFREILLEKMVEETNIGYSGINISSKVVKVTILWLFYIVWKHFFKL